MPASSGRGRELAGGVDASGASPLARSESQCAPRVAAPARALAPTGCGGRRAGEAAAAGSAPRREPAPRARVRARPPTGDPASSTRPLEVCKLSPGVPPHHREVGDAGREVPGSPSPLPPPLPPLDRTSGGFRTLPGLWRQTHTPDS